MLCKGAPRSQWGRCHYVADLPPQALPREIIISQHGGVGHCTPVCWSMQMAAIPGTAPPSRVTSVRVRIHVWYLAVCWLAPIPDLGGHGDACPLFTHKHVLGGFLIAGLLGIAVQASAMVSCLFLQRDVHLESYKIFPPEDWSARQGGKFFSEVSGDYLTYHCLNCGDLGCASLMSCISTSLG